MKSLLLPLALAFALVVPARAEDAKQVLDKTGVRGGLVVVIGCDDPDLLAGLRAAGPYLVHGLDTDSAKVEKARQALNTRGVYGGVSVDRFDGKRLPYVDDLASLVVAADLGGLPMAEVTRVLAPAGVSYVKQGGAWKQSAKPVPEGSDEWTHFLHDAGGNAVSSDRRIGPPKRLRWVAGPVWSRSHEMPSSVNAVVMANGRLFTIFDEAPAGVFRKLPWRCSLIARDANSGVLLWKVPMRDWQPEFGTGTGNRWNIHHTIPRRVVAEGDKVYVTLKFLDSPVSVLDAATGKTLVEALPGTKGADELILADGILVAKLTKKRSVAATARFGKDALDDTLVAVDVKTGKPLWRKEGTRVAPYALSAAEGKVVYHDMDALVCLDAKTGNEAWKAPDPIASTVGGGSNLVLVDGVVLYNGQGGAAAATKPQPDAKAKGKKKKKPAARLTLRAFSLKDGKPLWRHPSRSGWSAACTQPTDLFVTKGIVWCGTFEGRDLRTGEVKKTVTVDKLISPGHHYRCHRSKATERFLILPKRGAEFVDVEGDGHMRNDWLRAPCFTGLTPANGLLYVPPHQCFCYPGVKVGGYLAMDAGPADALKPASAVEQGGAFGKVPAGGGITNDDWPMHRHDGRRSGATKTAVPADVAPKWEIKLACRATQPVVVGDRLWVAEKDAHRIRCLDAGTGKDVWQYTAGGRIDSAPTIHDGTVLFGGRDGTVTCLRAADGALVWRFRAAPADRRTVSFEQVESLWPVHGSILVQDGKAYFAAGRSSFLDGGILVYALDAKTGKALHHHHLDGPWPDIKKDTGRPFATEGALPDLIVGDGSNLYMMRVKLDAKLNRLPTKRESDLGELDMGTPHLSATGGFLDDSGYDRIFWMHDRRWPGFYFVQHATKSGQLVVFDDAAAYAVKYFYRRHQWSTLFIPAEHGYLLFADAIDNESGFMQKGKKLLEWLPKESYSDSHRRGGQGAEKGTGYVREKPELWQRMIPVRVRAMVLAGGRLFAAGPPDVVDEKDPLAAFEGRKGATLQAFSAKDGKPEGKALTLESPPAFDGLVAARGRLYLATQDGKVICLAGK